MVERAAGARLAEHADATALDALEPLGERMAAGAERGWWAAVAQLDRAFHETLVDAAGNTRLSRMYGTLPAETAMCLAQLEPTYRNPRRPGERAPAPPGGAAER